MVLLMLMMIHVVVTILSNFLHLHITFNQTLVLMVDLFPLVKWYVMEPIYFQYMPILIIYIYKKITPIT